MFRKLRLSVFLILAALTGVYAQAPDGNFTPLPSVGCAPLTVSFSDISTNNPGTYTWNFGGGAPAVSPGPNNQKNTFATYNQPGTYKVTHTATNGSGTSVVTTTDITVYAVPIADFDPSKATGCYPTTIIFTNKSSSDVTSFIWDFGDGFLDNSTVSPSHIYTNSGAYPVTLAVKNANGCSGKASVKNVAKAITLSNPGVIPDFITNINSTCTLPVSVNFVNQTTGPATISYAWDFGDGLGWSNVQSSPSNSYSVAKTYKVKLAATSTAGCTDTAVVDVVISGNGNVSDFTGNGNICVNTVANFDNISSPNPVSATWDFGDGTTQNSLNGQHTYTIPGTYHVVLNNDFGGCTGTVTKDVIVVGPPTTAFTGTNLNGCKFPMTTQFTDLTPGATSWLWDFGNGTTSTLQNPQYTYTNYGSYQVSLTASSANGCSNKTTQTAFVNIIKPVATISNAPAYGCAPFAFSPTATITSAEGVATYAWDLGNGVVSNQAAPPVQTYTPGTYTISLTVTTNGGCITTPVTGIVKVGSVQPATSFSATPLSTCVGTPIQFTDNSPGANQWLWEFGDGSTDNTGPNPIYKYTKPGVYDVSLTAYNNGCFKKITVPAYITINPPLADFTFAFACGNKTNYSFTDKSIGATTWDWDFGDGTPHDFTANPTHVYATAVPKSYIVTLVVSNNTCFSTSIQTIDVNQTTTVNPIPTVCNNTTVPIFTTFPKNIIGFTFDFGDGFTASSGPSGATSHSWSKPGDYQIVVTTMDNNGCSETAAPYTMRVSGPTVNFTSPTLLSCGPLVANFIDQSTPYPSSTLTAWAWDYGDGGKATGKNPGAHTYSFQGIFPVKLKVTDNNGCSDSLTMPNYITVSIPVAKFSTPSTKYCPGGKPVKFTNLSSGGFGSTYDWNFDDGTTFTGANPTLHNYTTVKDYSPSLVIKDIYNCTSSYSNPIPIKVDTPNATFTMSSNYSACPPLTEVFTFAGHYDSAYSWNFDNGGSATIPNPSSIYAFPDDYYPKLIVTSWGGCTATFSDHIKIDGPIGVYSYSPLAGCDSLDVIFNVVTSNSVKFTWNFNDGKIDSGIVSSITHRYNVPNVYNPFVVLEDAGGCKVTYRGANQINVDAITKTEFTADKTILCDNGPVNFKDVSVLASNTTITSYQWDFGDGNTQTGLFPNLQHTYSAPGSYTVTMGITTLGGCSGTFNLPVNVVASPQIDINGLIPTCEPAVITLSGVELVNDPNGPLDWQWNFGNGKTASGQFPQPVDYPKAGKYTVQLIATNSKGCKDTAGTVDPVFLFIYPIPTVNAGQDATICLGSTLQLNATGSPSTTFNWDIPTAPGASLSCLNCVNPVASSPASTFFVVRGTSPNNCEAKDTIQVTVNVPVTVTVSGPDSVCLGQSTTLVASGAAIYSWTPAQGLSDPNIPNPVAKPDASQVGAGASTVINYQVTGYDSKKCFSDTKSIDVTAFNYPVINMVPNATINVGSSYQVNSTVSTNVVSLNWTPFNTLSCASCLTPLATPTKTTKYLLTAVNDGGCSTTDSFRLQVICNGANFFVPNTFSPNGDGANDYFIVNGTGLNVIPSITIYNRWGQIVFQKSNFAPNSSSSAWDGTFNGQPAPPDVYIYTIQILCDNATLIPYHGNVTLIR